MEQMEDGFGEAWLSILGHDRTACYSGRVWKYPLRSPVVRSGMNRSGNTGDTRLLAVMREDFFVSQEITPICSVGKKTDFLRNKNAPRGCSRKSFCEIHRIFW